jgi:hypothetical protein
MTLVLYALAESGDWVAWREVTPETLLDLGNVVPLAQAAHEAGFLAVRIGAARSAQRTAPEEPGPAPRALCPVRLTRRRRRR